MVISFLELLPAYKELKLELDAAWYRVMSSGWYLFGRELELFESEYAAYCGTKYCIAVGSGLDALHLALKAAVGEKGGEVIVPAHTYIATWLAVTQAGLQPVPVEPDEATCLIDVNRIEAAITPRTRAIIPVHLYGQPADMDAIMKIANRYGLFVLEDNAQAAGARYCGMRTGGLGHAAAHSFYPSKNLGAFADGGAVTTNDESLCRRVRMLRNYGSEKKYVHELQGMNSRLDELQAAILRVKLSRLDDWNKRRKQIAEIYNDEFGKLALMEGVQLSTPKQAGYADHVWHLYTIRHPSREALIGHLAQNGIQVQIHYPIPVHRCPAYLSGGRHSSWELPITDRICQTILSLPMGPHLSEAEARKVAAKVKEFLHDRKQAIV